jgi:hypothetical protein
VIANSAFSTLAGFPAADKWRARPDFPDPENPAYGMLAAGFGRKP